MTRLDLLDWNVIGEVQDLKSHDENMTFNQLTQFASLKQQPIKSNFSIFEVTGGFLFERSTRENICDALVD